MNVDSLIKPYTFAVGVFLGLFGGAIFKAFNIYDVPDMIGILSVIAVLLHIGISLSLSDGGEKVKRPPKKLFWSFFAAFLLSLIVFVHLKLNYTYRYEVYHKTEIRFIKTGKTTPLGDSLLKQYSNQPDRVIEAHPDEYALNERLWEGYTAMQELFLIVYLLVIGTYITFLSITTHYIITKDEDIVQEALKKLLKWFMAIIKSKLRGKKKPPAMAPESPPVNDPPNKIG